MSLIIDIGALYHFHGHQVHAALPVGHQLFAVIERPLLDDLGSLSRQAAEDDLTGLDRDKGFEALIGRMEVRGRMIVEIHPDDDAEEERDDGHCGEGAPVGAGDQARDAPVRSEDWGLLHVSP